MTSRRSAIPGLDGRERFMRGFFGLVDPLARRMIPRGITTGASNILLIVPGRRSGIEHTTPVTMLDLDGHRYVQATYGAKGWALNLRASGDATVVLPGGQRRHVHATEIPPDEAAAVLEHALGSYRHARFLRRVLGSRARPPVGIQRQLRISIDDPQDYRAESERHPLFELTAA